MAKRPTVPQFVNQVRTETGKVAWPTGQETIRIAIMVVIMTAILSGFFFVVDRFFGFIVQSLLQLAA